MFYLWNDFQNGQLACNIYFRKNFTLNLMSVYRGFCQCFIFSSVELSLLCKSRFFSRIHTCITLAKFYYHKNFFINSRNNENTRTFCKIWSIMTIMALVRRQCRSGGFIVNFEQISQVLLVFHLLTLNNYLQAGNQVY